MAKKILTSLDLNYNELLKAVLQNLASDPATSGLPKGYCFFNTTLNRPRFFNGTNITDFGDWLTAANYGSTGVGIFYNKASGVINLKKIDSGAGITVTDSGDGRVIISIGTLAISNITNLQTSLNAKANLVSTPTNGHILTTDSTGQPTDSGKTFNDSGTTTTDVWSASKTQSAINTATQGLASSLHTPVQSLANAVALTDYTDKQLLLIEDLGMYRFDAQSTATADNNLIIQPTNISGSNPGRWLKESNLLTDHNLLSNIQGGTTGDYQHLTTAQLTAATRTASGTQNGLLASTDYASFAARTKKFSADIGNGSATSIAVTHSLGTLDIHVAIYDKATNADVEADVVRTDVNTVTISFATAPTANQYRVVVIG